MMEITFFSYNVWPPTYVSWFINPMNILVLRFKYHKHSQTIVIGVLLNQLRYRLGGGHFVAKCAQKVMYSVFF